jgi:hypothetical protein
MASAGTEIIEVEGDLMRLVTRAVQYEIPLKDALPFLVTQQPITFPTEPRSQVFAHFDASNPQAKTLYSLAEIPPGIRNIRKGDRRYRLAMPWTYFWFVSTTSREVSSNSWSLEHYYVFHAKDRYVGLDSQMIVARLPNVYSSGKICWGTTGAPANLSIADRIDTLVNDWYISTFNFDLDGEVPLPYGEETYRRWVEESRANVSCWQNWPEWSNTNVEKFSTRTLLSINGITPSVENITLPAFIPPVETELTFGRWEDWFLRNTTPEQRGRAFYSLQNLRADDPIQVPEFVPVDLSDDGGVPINEALERPLRR